MLVGHAEARLELSEIRYIEANHGFRDLREKLARQVVDSRSHFRCLYMCEMLLSVGWVSLK